MQIFCQFFRGCHTFVFVLSSHCKVVCGHPSFLLKWRGLCDNTSLCGFSEPRSYVESVARSAALSGGPAAAQQQSPVPSGHEVDGPVRTATPSGPSHALNAPLSSSSPIESPDRSVQAAGQHLNVLHELWLHLLRRDKKRCQKAFRKINSMGSCDMCLS